jgi:hypothetical protein
MSEERNNDQALDEDVPDPAVGGGEETTVSKPASQEGVGEEEGQDGGVESVEEIAERSD